MARNEVLRDADHLSLPVADGTKAGVPVKVGGLVGVTQTTEGDGGNPDGFATVWTKGAHRLPVGSGGALTIGAPVYITSAGALSPTASGNDLFGYALEAKPSGAATIVVRIARV